MAASGFLPFSFSIKPPAALVAMRRAVAKACLHSLLPCSILQENILAESSAMLPDTRQRLEEAFRELQGLVVSPAPLAALPLMHSLPGVCHACSPSNKRQHVALLRLGTAPISSSQVKLQSLYGKCWSVLEERGVLACCRRRSCAAR